MLMAFAIGVILVLLLSTVLPDLSGAWKDS
jgi:hypothetical protein